MDERLERYAELVVRVGANVQPGQEVFLFPAVEHHELARALTRQAYRAGASYVNVLYGDMHVRKAMIELGPDQALTHTPGWLKTLVESCAGNALIATTGDPEPELLADVDGERIGRAVQQELSQIQRRHMQENVLNWCGIGAPGEAWARQVFGEPDLERLWDAVAFCMRLDEPDPPAAWREHLARLAERTAQLNELRPDALRYRGPGTDLTVGLLPYAAGCPRPRRSPRTGSDTSRTCRRRRCSPRPMRVAPTGRSARRCRCRATARSCAGWS